MNISPIIEAPRCSLGHSGRPLHYVTWRGKKKKNLYEWYSPPFSVHKHLPTNMLYSKCVTVYFLHVSPPLLALREVRDEGPGQPSPWGEHHPAVGRDRGSHLLHPARGHQQKHGECKGSRWHGRHREAGQHNQGQRRQVRYRSSYLSESFFVFVFLSVHTDTHPTVTCAHGEKPHQSRGWG